MNEKYQINLPERFKSHYECLGIPFNSDETKIENAYNKFTFQFDNQFMIYQNQLANINQNLENDKYCEKYEEYKKFLEKQWRIRESYRELIAEITARKKEYDENRKKQKKALKQLTKEMEDKEQARKELEKYKGPVWVVLEKLKNAPSIAKQTYISTDILSEIKENILTVLEQPYQEIYCNFLERFQQLWDELYQGICIMEIETLKRQSYSSSAAFSVGIDELTNKVSQIFPDEYDNYQDLFQYDKILTELIPESPKYYFLESHFDIITKNLLLEYKKSNFNDRIYSFMANARSKKFEEKYLNQFDLEVQQGIRKSVIVDNNEMQEYIFQNIKPYNILIQEESNLKK